jgi:hypothetical protein
VAAGAYWVFSPASAKFTATPLVFILGSLTVLFKGIFLLRPSSEGIGLSQQELEEARSSARHKGLPSIPAQAAQIAQDFGTGGFLGLSCLRDPEVLTRCLQFRGMAAD